MTTEGMTKGNWIAMAALCLSTIAGGYSLAVVPIKESIVATDAKLEKRMMIAEDKLEKVESRVVALERTQHGLAIKLEHIKASLGRIEAAVIEEHE